MPHDSVADRILLFATSLIFTLHADLRDTSLSLAYVSNPLLRVLSGGNQEKTRQWKPFIIDQTRSPRARCTVGIARAKCSGGVTRARCVLWEQHGQCVLWEWQTNLLEGRTIAATAARSSCSWVPVFTVASATCCATSGSSHRLLKSNGCVADASRCNTPCRTGEKGINYTFWRQFNEKPSIIPGCLVSILQVNTTSAANHFGHVYMPYRRGGGTSFHISQPSWVVQMCQGCQ